MTPIGFVRVRNQIIDIVSLDRMPKITINQDTLSISVSLAS
jgi:hypothetical protein